MMIAGMKIVSILSTKIFSVPASRLANQNPLYGDPVEEAIWWEVTFAPEVVIVGPEVTIFSGPTKVFRGKVPIYGVTGSTRGGKSCHQAAQGR